MRYYVIHPNIGNDLRQDVETWCERVLKDVYWSMRSNYKRTDSGTFDVYVRDRKAAEMFLLRWGGQIVDIEDVTEYGHKINFHKMFEAEL